MKKLKLNLKDVGEILTREQLKQVFGGSGGTCGWSGGSVAAPFCGISYQAAYNNFLLYGGNWCCDSCSSTWYCGPGSGW